MFMTDTVLCSEQWPLIQKEETKLKTGLKGQTCVGKCQTIDLIELVFMLQKMSKYIQVLLSVFSTLVTCL